MAKSQKPLRASCFRCQVSVIGPSLRPFKKSSTFSEVTVATATASPICLTKAVSIVASTPNATPIDCLQETYSCVASLRFIEDLPSRVPPLHAASAYPLWRTCAWHPLNCGRDGCQPPAASAPEPEDGLRKRVADCEDRHTKPLY